MPGPDYHGWTHGNGIDPIPFNFPDVGALIIRSGGAPSLNIASGSLNSTTTLLDDFDITTFNNNMTVDLSVAKITAIYAGYYAVLLGATWANTGSAWGGCIGFDVNQADGLVAPIDTVYVWPSDPSTQSGAFPVFLDAGDYVTMCAGQNSGSNKAAPLSTFAVYRLAESPITT